jgi:hypothetical protein
MIWSSKSRYNLEVSGMIIRLARYKYSRSSNAVAALAASPRPVNSFIRGMNNIPVLKRLADSRAFLGKAATSEQLHQLHHSGRYSPLLSFPFCNLLATRFQIYSVSRIPWLASSEHILSA